MTYDLHKTKGALSKISMKFKRLNFYYSTTCIQVFCARLPKYCARARKEVWPIKRIVNIYMTSYAI